MSEQPPPNTESRADVALPIEKLEQLHVWKNRIRAMIRGIDPSLCESDVDEISAIVFIKLVAKHVEHGGWGFINSSFASFVYQMIYHEIVNLIRRRQRQRALFQKVLNDCSRGLAEGELGDAEMSLDRKEIHDAVNRAISELVPFDQAICRLKMSGKTYNEIAKQIGCTEGKVRSSRRRYMLALANSRHLMPWKEDSIALAAADPVPESSATGKTRRRDDDHEELSDE